MKRGLFPRLALDGIKKNKRVYFPYILTCIAMVMMNYIFIYMQDSKSIRSMTGGDTLSTLMVLGGNSLIFFSAIFLFYTNSFLVRRRKKEFGLYNILGMGKRSIGLIAAWESIFVAVISLVLGIGGGMLFSKLAELILVNIVKGEVIFSYYVSFEGIKKTCIAFLVIFLLIFLNTLRQLEFSNTISLLKSESMGEKPPKANFLLGIAGVLLLAVAYYLAVSIEDPISALAWFFIAVVLVIAGTYLVMISGSVMFLSILKKIKGYYYNPKHFVSVSSMVYRMKRNGAGLASICILATMVLVMLSSTFSLYIGEDDTLMQRYPREINISVYQSEEDFAKGYDEQFKGAVDRILADNGVEAKNEIRYASGYIAGLMIDGHIEVDNEKVYSRGMDFISDVYSIYVISIDDYNRMMGENKTLADDEALLWCSVDYDYDTIAFNRGASYKIKEHVDGLGIMTDVVSKEMGIVVNDVTAALSGHNFSNGEPMANYHWYYSFDTGLDYELESKIVSEISNYFSLNKAGLSRVRIESREENRIYFYNTFGGLFFIGILLSIVCIVAAVLIIYYKQVSEGYEDQGRFLVMRKVGMTKKEIRKSINSQILIVFFLPLLLAGLHMVFAFSIVEKLLLLFQMNNHMLFVYVVLGCFAVFAVFYTIVYRLTSNAYYNIVSSAKRE